MSLKQSLDSYIFRKKMERHIEQEKVALKPKYGAFKGIVRAWWAWNVKPKLQSTMIHLKAIERLPFSILFTIYILCVFIFMGLFSQVVYQKWVNDIINTYPEAVQAQIDPETGQPTYSPLDAIFVPIQATNQAWYFLMSHIVIGMFLVDIWTTYNPRKPQSFNFRGG